ncbi:MAG: hypothetical protein Q9187_004531 [Circinaria calcarea]
MVVIDDVEFYIVSTGTGSKFHEYDNPERDQTANENEVEKYIEAETNVEFGIVAVLKAGFNYHNADGVNLRIEIDGTRRAVYYPKNMVNIEAERLIEEVKLERKTMRIMHQGSCYTTRFSFASVTVDTKTLGEQIKTLGSITVAVQRVYSKRLEEPQSWDRRLKHDVEGLDKKLLVKNISHCFQPVMETKLSAPPVVKRTETPMEGRHGQRNGVVYRYRSHCCIPTTPPPAPISERGPAEMTDEEKVSEIIRMRTEILSQREEILQLKRANQKLNREADEANQIKERMTVLQAALGGLSAVTMPTTVPSSAVTPTARTSSIKRERVKVEGQDDAVAFKDHRAKRPKPVYLEHIPDCASTAPHQKTPPEETVPPYSNVLLGSLDGNTSPKLIPSERTTAKLIGTISPFSWEIGDQIAEVRSGRFSPSLRTRAEAKVLIALEDDSDVKVDEDSKEFW